MGFNKQEIFNEFRKTDFKKDPIRFTYFFRYGLNSQTQDYETLPLLDFEKDVINHLDKNDFSLINKSRQMNLTSLLASFVTWKMIFNKKYKILVVSHHMDGSKKFINLVLQNLENTSPEIFNSSDIVNNNAKELSLKNGSCLLTSVDSKTTGRSHSYDMVIFDECDYMKNLSIMYSSMLAPVLKSKDPKMILISTPNLKGSFFEKSCRFAKKGASSFEYLKLHWSINPYFNKGLKQIPIINKPGLYSFTSPWYEKQCRQFGYNQDSIDSQLDLKFIKSPEKKTKIISLRLEGGLVELLNKKTTNVSKYIRSLIENDLRAPLIGSDKKTKN